MRKFYEGCLACTFCKDKCCGERCFDCAQAHVSRFGSIYSFGTYYSRIMKEHHDSKWSRAVIKAKKGLDPIISTFGRILAFYMDKSFAGLKPYILTNVPGLAYEDACLFAGFNRSSVERLALTAFQNLEQRQWVTFDQVLIQTGRKERKQRQCKSIMQRMRNVEGVYGVKENCRVEGRNIVVIDDITTSGATIGECSKVLLQNGARNVVGVALARTVRLRP